MTPRQRRRIAIPVSGALFLVILSLALGVRVNTTQSVPVGFYLIRNAPVERGAYVLLCPPDTPLFREALDRGYLGAGFCPHGYGYVMKRVLAAKNDVVEIDTHGVRVNGALLPFSVPRTADRAGRPLAPYPIPHFTVADNDILVMGDVSATSWDSRYYGPVPRRQVQAVLVPLITW